MPYQSVVQPDGRYAYNPNQDQYPRKRGQGLFSARTAFLPQARQFEFTMNRSDNFVHQPGEVVTMGINHDRMRTAAPPSQQPMLDHNGRPVLPPGSVAAQGSLGPPPNPRNPADRYGGGYGGQRWFVFIGYHSHSPMTDGAHWLEACWIAFKRESI